MATARMETAVSVESRQEVERRYFAEDLSLHFSIDRFGLRYTIANCLPPSGPPVPESPRFTFNRADRGGHRCRIISTCRVRTPCAVGDQPFAWGQRQR